MEPGPVDHAAGELARLAAALTAWSRRYVSRLLANAESGQAMVEYGIVICLLALVSMIALQTLGLGISQVFANILGKIQGLGR